MILQLRDVDMLELCSMFSSVLISLSLLVFVYAEVYYMECLCRFVSPHPKTT